LRDSLEDKNLTNELDVQQATNMDVHKAMMDVLKVLEVHGHFYQSAGFMLAQKTQILLCVNLSYPHHPTPPFNNSVFQLKFKPE
jgi:hypothetical protein